MKDDFNNTELVDEETVDKRKVKKSKSEDLKSGNKSRKTQKTKKNNIDNDNINETKDVVINVIEDEPYEDLSAFYNVKDIGVLDSEEELSDKKNQKAGKIIAICFAAILIVGVCIGVYFGFIKDNNTYYTMYEKDSVYSNGTIKLEFEQLNILDSLLTYEFDEDYVYVALVYNFTNVSQETLDWSATPYMSMKPYVYVEGKGYVPMEVDSEEAAMLIALLSDDVKNEIKDDHTADIVDNDDTTDTSDEGLNQGADSDIGANDDASQDNTPQKVEIENNVLYGNFDFGALQIFALDYGVDFSTVKDDLLPGETRQSADVFKIRKELFDNNIFFIGADNLDAIFKIDLTPVDTTNINNTGDDTQSDVAN